MTPELFYGLWLNARRQRRQIAIAVMEGVENATGGRVPEAFGDALAVWEEEADEQLFDLNAFRAMVRACQNRK